LNDRDSVTVANFKLSEVESERLGDTDDEALYNNKKSEPKSGPRTKLRLHKVTVSLSISESESPAARATAAAASESESVRWGNASARAVTVTAGLGRAGNKPSFLFKVVRPLTLKISRPGGPGPPFKIIRVRVSDPEAALRADPARLEIGGGGPRGGGGQPGQPGSLSPAPRPGRTARPAARPAQPEPARHARPRRLAISDSSSEPTIPSPGPP
jgi:hypothetical protein